LGNKVEVSKEGLQAVRQALKALSSVKGDLPLKARRAMGVLASTLGYGSVEDEIAQDGMDALYKSYLNLQSLEEDQATGAALTVEAATALKKVIVILGSLLKQNYEPKGSHYYATSRPEIPLFESASLSEAVEGKAGLDWEIRLIRSGLSVNRKYYPESVLRDAVDKFEDAKVYADHPTKTEEQERPERSVRDIVGWIDGVRYEGNGRNGLYGTFHALDTQKWFADLVREAYERGKPDLLGFSIRAWGKDKIKRIDDQLVHSVEQINRVMSVDAVTEPAAGGGFVKLLASARTEEEIEMSMIDEMTLEELQEHRPDLLEAFLEAKKRELEEDAKKLTPKEYHKKYGEYPEAFQEATKGLSEEARTAFSKCVAEKMKGGMGMVDAAKSCKDEAAKKAEDTSEEATKLNRPEGEVTFGKGDKGRIGDPAPRYDEETQIGAKLQEAVEEKAREAEEGRKELEEKLTALEARLEKQAKLSESAAILEVKLAGVKLPDVTKALLRNQFEGQVFEEAKLQEALDTHSKYLSDLEGSYLPSEPARVHVLSAETDKLRLAVAGMIDGEDLEDPKTNEKVPAFRSMREAYCAVTGKSPWQVRPEEIIMESRRGYDSGLTYLREAVETASWTQILGDSITRRLLKEYALPFLDEWKLVVSDIIPLKDFRTQRRPRMGGYGKLPVIGEGSTYVDLTTITDEEVTYAPSKKGGLDSITLEAIANDDLGAVRRIPIKLARAAKRTLYEFVFDFLATNAAIYDGAALAVAGHINIIATALTWANISAAKQLLREQQEYQTAQVLNLTPKYLIVPAELESMAIRIRDSDFEFLAGQAAIGSINIHKGGFDVIVCGYWTDANNWWIVADPTMNPTIEVGFFQGRQEPELFTEREGAGDHFTADKVVYKIRHIYGGAVLDYRTFVGGIVA